MFFDKAGRVGFENTNCYLNIVIERNVFQKITLMDFISQDSKAPKKDKKTLLKLEQEQTLIKKLLKVIESKLSQHV